MHLTTHLTSRSNRSARTQRLRQTLAVHGRPPHGRTGRRMAVRVPILLAAAAIALCGLTPSAPEVMEPVLAAAAGPAQAPNTTPSTEPVPVPPGCEDRLPTPCPPAAASPDSRLPLMLPGSPASVGPEACDGFGCLPTTTGPGATPGTAAGGAGAGGTAPAAEPAPAPCGFTDLGGCVGNAIDEFFRGVVTAALNPLLDLLSGTLLTTPELGTLPGLGELWAGSWQILLACYGLLVLIAAVVIMSFESLQTRYTAKQMGPRIVIGFLAGALSLWAATRAVQVANGISQAVLGDGVDPTGAGQALRDITLGSLTNGSFVVILGVVLVAMLLALLVGYVIRVVLTIVLVAGAPVALMFHALPQTDTRSIRSRPHGSMIPPPACPTSHSPAWPMRWRLQRARASRWARPPRTV